jgi:hypothetical protein
LEKVLEPMLQTLNVSRDELQQKFGHDLSQMIQLEINFYGSEIFVSFNNRSRLSYLGFSKFCYTISLDTVSFSNELEHLDISINMSTPSSLINHVITGTLNFFLDFRAYLTESDDIENIDHAGTSDSLIIKTHFSKQNNHTLGISGHYISISQTNGGKQCTTDFSKDVCQAKCRIQQIEKLCNCSPTTWPMLMKTPDSNNCNLAQYKHCLRFNVTGTY